MMYLFVFFVFFGLSFDTLFLFFSRIDFDVDVIVTVVSTIYRPSKKIKHFLDDEIHLKEKGLD